MHDTPVDELVGLITANLALAVAGSAAALRRYLSDGTPGAVVTSPRTRRNLGGLGAPGGVGVCST